MTIRELQTFFKTHLVPKKLYKLDGKHNKRICLEHGKDGWEIFFCDKNAKVGLIRTKDETAACDVMKDEVRKLMEQMYGVSWAA